MPVQEVAIDVRERVVDVGREELVRPARRRRRRRRRPLHSASREHRRREVGRRPGVSGRRGVAEAGELDEIATEGAAREMLGAAARFGGGEGPCQQVLEPELQIAAAHVAVPYDGSSVRIARASSMRARWARDLTVPSGRERSSAISSSLSSWVSLRRIISRFFSLSSPRAR